MGDRGSSILTGRPCVGSVGLCILMGLSAGGERVRGCDDQDPARRLQWCRGEVELRLQIDWLTA